jgi:hypothetical protein
MAISKSTDITNSWIAVTINANEDATSNTINYASSYGGVVHLQMTNPEAGPLTTPTIWIQGGSDVNGNGLIYFYELTGLYTIGTANSASRSWTIEIPPGLQYARARCVGGSNANVNVSAVFVKTTSL